MEESRGVRTPHRNSVLCERFFPKHFVPRCFGDSVDNATSSAARVEACCSAGVLEALHCGGKYEQVCANSVHEDDGWVRSMNTKIEQVCGLLLEELEERGDLQLEVAVQVEMSGAMVTRDRADHHVIKIFLDKHILRRIVMHHVACTITMLHARPRYVVGEKKYRTTDET